MLPLDPPAPAGHRERDARGAGGGEATPAAAEAAPLPPRRVFFEDPDRTVPHLSPDGSTLAWMEPRDGALNLVVAPVGDVAHARQLTHVKGRSIGGFTWAFTNRHIVFLHDDAGSENDRPYSVAIDGGEVLPLLPAGARSFVQQRARLNPNEMLFGHNGRDRTYFDLIRVNIVTGESHPLFQNPGFADLYTTPDFTVRFAGRYHDDGSAELMRWEPDGTWSRFLEIPAEDAMTTELQAISSDGRSAFLIDTRGRDKAALVEIDIATRETRVLAEDPEVDIERGVYRARQRPPARGRRGRGAPPLAHGRSGLGVRPRPLGGGATRRRCRNRKHQPRLGQAGRRLRPQRCRARIPPLRPAQAVVHAAVQVAAGAGRTGAAADAPGFHPGQRRRDAAGLPDTARRRVPQRSGGAAHPRRPVCPRRMGYSATHQFLASRGYGVLAVNYRGSTGYGKRFVALADKAWGARMQDDLTDAAAWLIAQGIADPMRLGFSGASYGGYAALMAATRTPDTFACIIDLFGPSNLVTMMRSFPAYWGPWLSTWKQRLADPETEAGRAWLTERSPLTHVDRIARPLLIGQGLHDVRVPPRESEQIVQALQKRDIPVTYVTFADEGHGFPPGQPAGVRRGRRSVPRRPSRRAGGAAGRCVCRLLDPIRSGQGAGSRFGVKAPAAPPPPRPRPASFIPRLPNSPASAVP